MSGCHVVGMDAIYIEQAKGILKFYIEEPNMELWINYQVVQWYTEKALTKFWWLKRGEIEWYQPVQYIGV
jgi:hypothetical protein